MRRVCPLYLVGVTSHSLMEVVGPMLLFVVVYDCHVWVNYPVSHSAGGGPGGVEWALPAELRNPSSSRGEGSSCAGVN